MAEQSDTHSIGFDELAEPLASGLDGLDRERAVSLGDLADSRKARAAVMERERSRLTRKLGPEHPRVRAIGAELAINANLVRDLRREAETAAVPDPVPDPDTWLLHGHVRDSEGKGKAGLTLALYDTGGNRDRDLGYACTDQEGYFRLTKRQPEEESRQLRVLDPAGESLLVDELPLTPRPGVSDYRVLRLAEGQTPCTGPEAPPTGDQPHPNGWAVRGRVMDPQGQGIPGLIVTLYDKDLFFDDRLGQTETGEDGSYHLSYRTRDFRDLFERKPDLYLEVRAEGGEVLYCSSKGIRYEAGRVEIMDVTIRKWHETGE